MPRYQDLQVDEVLHETDDAFLFEIDGEEVWFPKSQMESTSGIAKGHKNIEVSVATWLLKEKGFDT